MSEINAVKTAFTDERARGELLSQIQVMKTEIDGLYVIDPTVHGDSRGYFMETYNRSDFHEAGLDMEFVQDNQSSSRKGVLRGLHFQKNHPQAKLVRVLSGEVFDVAVDLRENSDTYGKWVGVLLSADNKKQLMIPRGFAHGFLVVSDMAEFAYKCDDVYHPEDEGGVMYNSCGIDWPEIDVEPVLSEKDMKHPALSELDFKFKF